MTLSEEIDKIFANRINPLDGQMNLNDAEQEQFQSEILALFERKMNEVVPDRKEIDKFDLPPIDMKSIYQNEIVDEMKRNIKKVLEGV